MTLKVALHGTLPEGTVSQGSRLAELASAEDNMLIICAGHHKHLQRVSVFPGTVHINRVIGKFVRLIVFL